MYDREQSKPEGDKPSSEPADAPERKSFRIIDTTEEDQGKGISIIPVGNPDPDEGD